MDSWVSEWAEHVSRFSGKASDHVKLIASTGAAATTILSTSGLWTILPSAACFVRGPDKTSTACTTSTGGRLAAGERGYMYVPLDSVRYLSVLGAATGSCFCDRLRDA